MNIKLVLLGMRPKTLAAAFVPPLLAQAYASYEGLGMSVYTLYCLFLAIFLQIATNFYNDAVDSIKGADEKRVGPQRLGGQFKVPAKQIFLVGHIFLILAFLCAVPIFLKGGLLYVFFGILSAFLAYGYTGGPFPLAYLGLGEPFVFIFFGHVATLGTYFLISDKLDLNIILIASIVGFLSSTLIGINNFRDRHNDKEVNKRTLATRMTEYQYLKLMDVFLFAPYIISFYFTIFEKLSFVVVLLAVGITHKIRFILRYHKDPTELNQALGLAGKQLIVFSILFWLGSLWKSTL